MNLFQEILPGVREVLSRASAFQIQALLDLMSESGIISREYLQTLLHEKDREDLARKICLTLVGRQDLLPDSFAPQGHLQFCGDNRGDAWEAKSARTRSLGDTMMGSEVLLAKGYLDLLQSDLDPQLLYKNIEDDLSTGHAPDVGLEDQDNNLDLFYTVENDGTGEEVCLCSNPGEAYEKIAELAEYVLKDKPEEPVKDLFGSLNQDDAVTDGCSEPKTQRRSCSDAPEPKRQKLAHSPGLCSRNSSPAAFPLDASPPEAISLSNFHVQFSVTTISPMGRLPKIFGPPDPVLDTEGIQMFLAFLPPSPQLDFPLGPAMWDNNVYLVEDAVEEAPEILPLPSEKADKRPESVDAFSRQLKTSLGERCRFVPAERDVLMDRLYVEGDLLRRHAENRSGRNADLRAGDLEEKERTTVESLFQTLERNELGANKAALVLGKAGMGKSLLVQKICLDWSSGRFAQFEFVFRFDCRRLSLLQGKRYSLRQLLFEFSVDPQEGGDGDVYRYLLQNPDRVLLIFDGFEELQDLEGFSLSSDSLTRKEPWGIGAVLGGLFQKKALNGCTLLLTSRPKDKLHQYLPRVDKVLEVVGFSPQQAEVYLARYFEGCPYCGDARDLITSATYLFSYCHNPDLCRIICLVCKSAFEAGDGELPSSLTGLLVRFLLQKLGCAADEGTSPKHGNISTLAQIAWSLGQGPQQAPTSVRFPSIQDKEAALKCGIMEPLASSDGGEECGYAFSSFVVENFLAALHLVLAKEIKDKRLTKHLWVPSKPKKSLCSWDLVPRFLAGLLFFRDDRSSSSLFGEEGEVDPEKMIAKKRNSLCRYIRKLEMESFGPDKLLEVFHCVRETEDPFLLQHLALRVRPALSFFGFPFTPPDVYVLHSVLRKANKEFALDLRRSSVGSEGLGRLVCLQNVTSFRAPLGDTVQLWERLWETAGGERLRSAVEKFVIDPFKAQTVKDVDDLSALVDMQEKMRRSKVLVLAFLKGLLTSREGICREHPFRDSGCNQRRRRGLEAPYLLREAGPSGCDVVREVPAVVDLRHLEFALGPTCGLKGFKKLVEILGAFPALRHLDLDSQKENEIGDEGAAALSDVLPALRSLETLNLSQNKITNMGAEKLANALPSLPSLRTLSVYNNSIGDAGAENFAKVLPELTSLRVLNVQCNKITAAGAQRLTDSLRKCPHIQSVALWNPKIPHGILKHLRQLDSRIRSL
ncbi:PREDICTED: MHC class II transactivator [Gekko japonicus]|uniref:MHC class II transactivator n=1 Tax=Gekko japonicus TaxID=146911 RepID=A0ABM1JV76_GEKJA|nr:PREDICTED: MHC class II transactivator [Gekko japonicus]